MIDEYLIMSSFNLLKPQTGLILKYIIKDSITSASTKTSPSIGTRGTEPRNRTDNTGKVGAMAITAMQSRDLTPTLLPKNENGKLKL